MSIYHCSIKPISRGNGRSSTAASAYRAGEKIKDLRTGEIHDYTRKQGVEHTELVLPNGVDINREQLWNSAEKSEKRKDARVAREFEVALPTELTKEQRKELAVNFAQSLVGTYGVGADVAIHEPNKKGDQRNYHAHILITTRQLSPRGLGDKTDLEREDKALRSQGQATGREQIEQLRKQWANQCNLALERAGQHDRVSHKSLEAQGINREPTSHLGHIATAMERRGIQTERGNLNRNQVENKQTEKELAQAENIQSGSERMRQQAQTWRLEQERAKQIEHERQEVERKALEKERMLREQKKQQTRSINRGMGMSR